MVRGLVSFICTLEYYEILNSRFALEHRLDATEPEGFPNANVSTYLGDGNAYFNTYSLMTTRAIADGLREDFIDAQGARVFSLTRSSFAGQQRYGATLWSGDVSGNWESLRRQVSASLNYALSGMPYVVLYR